jgi:hypothetical protein
VIRLITVRAARALDAIDAAGRWCTAVMVSTGLRCDQSAGPNEVGLRIPLYVVPIADAGPDEYAVLCRDHFDQIRRDDRKAAEARAVALAAETQTSLF